MTDARHPVARSAPRNLLVARVAVVVQAVILVASLVLGLLYAAGSFSHELFAAAFGAGGSAGVRWGSYAAVVGAIGVVALGVPASVLRPGRRGAVIALVVAEVLVVAAVAVATVAAAAGRPGNLVLIGIAAFDALAVVVLAALARHISLR